MDDRKTQIAYIDDEEVNLFLFKQIFQRYYEVHTCISADEGMELLENNKDIKVAIVDMNMPEKDGLVFINEAREKFVGIVYMILTGYAVNDEIVEAIKTDTVSNYLSKPFDVDSVVKAIDQAVSSPNRE